MVEQLMDALCAVREALDIPEGASARAAQIRSKALSARAGRVVTLLRACVASEDLVGEVAELRAWVAANPVAYVTVEQASAGLSDAPPDDDRTYTPPGGVLALPRDGLPAWVGPSYLARLWRVSPRTVTWWADNGLLTCSWEGGSRRFARLAIEEFARDAIPVRLLRPGTVVQHPDWAEGMPVRIVLVEQAEGALWNVSYRLHSDETRGSGTELVTALARASRLVLRYPARKAEQ